MSDSVSPSAGDERSTAPYGRPDQGRTPPLRLTVVSYDEGSDRATIHPPNRTGFGRMETWLSVDVSVLVDRSAWR